MSVHIRGKWTYLSHLQFSFLKFVSHKPFTIMNAKHKKWWSSPLSIVSALDNYNGSIALGMSLSLWLNCHMHTSSNPPVFNHSSTRDNKAYMSLKRREWKAEMEQGKNAAECYSRLSRSADNRQREAGLSYCVPQTKKPLEGPQKNRDVCESPVLCPVCPTMTHSGAFLCPCTHTHNWEQHNWGRTDCLSAGYAHTVTKTHKQTCNSKHK